MRRFTTLTAALGLALAAPAGAQQTADGFRGVWWTDRYDPVLAPQDGSAIPFTPAGRAAYARNVAGLKDGSIVDQADYLCLPEGMPRAMMSAYPFQIIATPGQVTFAHEVNRAYRLVAFSDRHADPKVWDPSYMGDGVARLDGNTLVIDSTNFKADMIYLDSSGLPAGPKLHLVERLRLLAGGRQLEDVITIDDPEMFARPWTVRRTFARHDEVQLKTDWTCGEKHRDVSAITGRNAK